jgi:thiol:disulfide interchange protein
MRFTFKGAALFLAVVAPAVLPVLILTGSPQYPARGPDIYDTTADAGADIEAAFAKAKADGRRIVLDFGANWCVWCHKLHHLFTTDAEVRAALESDYIVVMVDVNTRNGPARNAGINARYGNPIQHGLPVLVVLDPDGGVLVTQETGALESGENHDPAKVLAFLAKWAHRPAGAE